MSLHVMPGNCQPAPLARIESDKGTQISGWRSKVKAGNTRLMSDIKKGMVAGGVATAVISLAMLLLNATGLEPQLHLTRLLLTLLEAPSEYALGWLTHIFLGSIVLGGLFVHVEPRLGADTHTKSGVLYGVAVWLVMMMVFMPAVGGGYFGFQLSVFTPIIMLGLQVLYGAVLGWTYGKLSPTQNSFTKRHPA